ncbi:MAG: 3-dehydroquinate synthase [Planctomycetota bacterium]|nr:3-dehydroquinate synthase [Planctomycetota bacterium]
MSSQLWSFTVSYRFPVTFTRDVFAIDNPHLLEVVRSCENEVGAPVRAAVFVDQAVLAARPRLERDIIAWFAHHAEHGLALAASPYPVSGGEAIKDGLPIIERVARICVDLHLCRHSYLIIIGGGAVLDAVGLAASLVHRGLRHIRLPTTTLAQCDAGLGVKNAVNLFGIKNLIGSFTPPTAVINDLRFLETQDARTWRAGLAEAVKVAIIKDAEFFARLEALAPALAARDATAMAEAVQRCATLHLEHITGSGDPFERGTSRPLDYGHWLAHRLEALSQHRLQHGEAVAIGVAADSLYAASIGRLSSGDAERVVRLLQRLGFRLWDACFTLRDAQGRRQVYAGLEQFREHLGGQLTLAMPDGLGRQRDIASIDIALYEQALAQLRRCARRAVPCANGR